MKSKILAGSLVLSALFASLSMTPVMAQDTNTPGIDRAQQEISSRIQQGLASGQISPAEAQGLYRREREIQMYPWVVSVFFMDRSVFWQVRRVARAVGNRAHGCRLRTSSTWVMAWRIALATAVSRVPTA